MRNKKVIKRNITEKNKRCLTMRVIVEKITINMWSYQNQIKRCYEKLNYQKKKYVIQKNFVDKF